MKSLETVPREKWKNATFFFEFNGGQIQVVINGIHCKFQT